MNYIKDILKFLSINNNIELIGANSKGNLKHSTDYDTQEVVLNIDPLLILSKFQQKFRDAKKTDYLYIMDLKAGTFKTVPLRWNYDTIMQGFQMIDNVKLNFIDTLHNDFGNVVKLDVTAFFNGEFHEFSCNYYFSNEELPDEQLYNSLLLDVKKYYLERKYMKMLKRLYSFFLKVNKKDAKKLAQFFNSDAGKYYQLKHKTDVIIEVMENKFKKVDKSQLSSAIHQLKNEMPNEYKNIVNTNTLQQLSDALHEQINRDVANFVEDF